MLGLVAFKVG